MQFNWINLFVGLKYEPIFIELNTHRHTIISHFALWLNSVCVCVCAMRLCVKHYTSAWYLSIFSFKCVNCSSSTKKTIVKLMNMLTAHNTRALIFNNTIPHTWSYGTKQRIVWNTKPWPNVNTIHKYKYSLVRSFNHSFTFTFTSIQL